jgi:hypothetical protein
MKDGKIQAKEMKMSLFPVNCSPGQSVGLFEILFNQSSKYLYKYTCTRSQPDEL